MVLSAEHQTELELQLDGLREESDELVSAMHEMHQQLTGVERFMQHNFTQLNAITQLVRYNVTHLNTVARLVRDNVTQLAKQMEESNNERPVELQIDGELHIFEFVNGLFK